MGEAHQDGVGGPYRTVGLAEIGFRSRGFYSISVEQGQLVVRGPFLLARWVRPFFARQLESLASVRPASRVPIGWRLQGVSGVELSFTDGSDVKLGVRHPERLIAALKGR